LRHARGKTYEAGAKLDWHSHPGGQVPLITEGAGAEYVYMAYIGFLLRRRRVPETAKSFPILANVTKLLLNTFRAQRPEATISSSSELELPVKQHLRGHAKPATKGHLKTGQG
jgi:hypothetical protein